jgi:uncharacterized protein YegP (UPF0339 family)
MQFMLMKNRVSKQWHFNLVADNGEIVMSSESYKAKAKAKKTIKSIVEALGKDKVIVTEVR